MTDLQKAELIMVLQAFKENKAFPSDSTQRLENCEAAIEQIIDILIEQIIDILTDDKRKGVGPPYVTREECTRRVNAEREACAALAENPNLRKAVGGSFPKTRQDECVEIAVNIRARGAK